MKKDKKICFPYLIGIAGPSGSGKTTLTYELRKRLGEHNCQTLSLDNYYYDLRGLSNEAKEKHNYDHPDALEFSTLLQDLNKIKSGESIYIPIYDFSCHERKKRKLKLVPKKFLILEGILTFYNPDIVKALDFKIFLDIELDICLIRRVKRDVLERNRTVNSVYEQYINTVRPMYFEYVRNTKKNADYVLKKINHNTVDRIISIIITRYK